MTAGRVRRSPSTSPSSRTPSCGNSSAGSVDLHPTDKPEEGAPQVRAETTMGALDAAFVALEEPGADDDATRDLVREAVTGADTGLKNPALGQFLDLVVSLIANWRITTAWGGEHEGQRSTMARAWPSGTVAPALLDPRTARSAHLAGAGRPGQRTRPGEVRLCRSVGEDHGSAAGQGKAADSGAVIPGATARSGRSEPVHRTLWTWRCSG